MTPSHPVVSLLVGLSHGPITFSHCLVVPHSVLVFGFQTVKSKPGQAVSPGMKDRTGHRRGDESRGWEMWETWAGNVEGTKEVSLDGRWIALPKYGVIHQNINDVSRILGPKINITRADKRPTEILTTSLFLKFH